MTPFALVGAPLVATEVTDWPQRLLLTALMLLALAAVLALMRLGWVRRGRRQGDIAPLPSVPPTPSDAAGLAASARYLGTTRAGDWLDRVVVHGLGVPSAAELVVGAGGVWCLRAGAPDLYLAPDHLLGARHDRALAGQVFEDGGVLVITWRHGEATLDTGLRVPDAEVAERMRQAVADLAASHQPHQPHPAPPAAATSAEGAGR